MSRTREHLCMTLHPQKKGARVLKCAKPPARDRGKRAPLAAEAEAAESGTRMQRGDLSRPQKPLSAPHATENQPNKVHTSDRSSVHA